MRPQAFLVEKGDFTQGIVAAAMGVTGEIIQRLEFAEDRDVVTVQVVGKGRLQKPRRIFTLDLAFG